MGATRSNAVRHPSRRAPMSGCRWIWTCPGGRKSAEWSDWAQIAESLEQEQQPWDEREARCADRSPCEVVGDDLNRADATVGSIEIFVSDQCWHHRCDRGVDKNLANCDDEGDHEDVPYLQHVGDNRQTKGRHDQRTPCLDDHDQASSISSVHNDTPEWGERSPGQKLCCSDTADQQR